MEYDGIVIGSGQGGGPLAHKLADLGWRMALIEREYLGGSCINYGCTPTKTMIASASVAHYARRAPEFGVHVGKVTVNLAEVVARKDKLVLEWRQGQQEQVDKRPTLDLYRGHGRFIGPHTIEVNGRSLASKHIFIDTGTRPRVVPIPGLDGVDYLTNRNIMALTEAPEHLIIVGGSYLGLEFGQMFGRFGSRVTVVERGDQIMSREDEEVAQALQEALAAEGIVFHLGAEATRVAKNGSGLEVMISYQNGRAQTLAGSHLLLAAGQVPNSDDLGMEAAGIERDEDGYIQVNDRLESNVAGVWAIGDVKGGPAFTHVSYDDHLVIYDNLIHNQNRSVKDRIIPYALYTDPELGRVGLTEKAAREAGYKLKVGKIPMARIARARERGETAGLMKVVVNAADDRILGAAILGTAGGELVQTLMALMMAKAPYTLFEKAMFIHPTLTEGFFALMDNVERI